jgi:nicotinic acid mononucleotide adenylyltransferase
MSGISHLYDLYNKKGQDFIEKLFNTYVTVNEKMDGSAFIFERSLENGKFKFYKRDQRNPITMVDRTLMKYYEVPIQYIESLPPHILNKIPRGWKFGLEYFSSPQPVEIAYDRIPKNNLILSYVHVIEEPGVISRTIQEKEKLDEWADLLGVERPPIIFQGNLDEDQKNKIQEFLRTPFEELIQEFRTKSFVRFIIGILNPELKKTALNEDLDKAIEGIVFRFGDPEGGDPVLSKMVDPIFTEMAKNKAAKRKDEKPSDFLGITLIDVMNFILERGVDSFQCKGDTNDQRYVSFMSSVFVEFLNQYSDRYKGADFQEPEYLKKDEFRINKKFITNKEVINYLEEEESFESLFKLMLNSFRKIKKRAGGMINQGALDQFNSLVQEIQNKVEAVKESLIFESELPTFLDFKRKNSDKNKINYVTEESDSEKDEDPFYSYNEFISALETIDNTKKPKTELIEEEKDQKELEDVNVLIGRFQPFHNGHLKMAKVMKEKNNLPCIIAVVHPGHNSSGKSPFDEDLVKKYMEAVVRENGDTICGFFIINRGLLGVIYGTAKNHGFNIKLIGAGEDRISDYNKQIEYLKKNGSDFPKDMSIVKTPRSTSATEVREKIKNEDFTAFKKLVPSSISSLYNSLVTGMNSHIKTNESLEN